eukprot:10762245-Ditylum_brightwellii.AAC.1
MTITISVVVYKCSNKNEGGNMSCAAMNTLIMSLKSLWVPQPSSLSSSAQLHSAGVPVCHKARNEE